jgi:hypothetical protein
MADRTIERLSGFVIQSGKQIIIHPYPLRRRSSRMTFRARESDDKTACEIASASLGLPF